MYNEKCLTQKAYHTHQSWADDLPVSQYVIGSASSAGYFTLIWQAKLCQKLFKLCDLENDPQGQSTGWHPLLSFVHILDSKPPLKDLNSRALLEVWLVC